MDGVRSGPRRLRMTPPREPAVDRWRQGDLSLQRWPAFGSSGKDPRRRTLLVAKTVGVSAVQPTSVGGVGSLEAEARPLTEAIVRFNRPTIVNSWVEPARRARWSAS